MQISWTTLAVGSLAVAGLAIPFVTSAPSSLVSAQAPAGPDPSLERSRQQIKMLDELYKNAVVSVTTRYVQKQGDQPAALVAKDVFGAMAKSGHHRARLVDASGQPQNKDNVAATEFEKLAVAAMKEGKPYFDRVVESGGKRKLQAATIVPAVMKQCADCHGVREGELLGTIVYEIPID